MLGANPTAAAAVQTAPAQEPADASSLVRARQLIRAARLVANDEDRAHLDWDDRLEIVSYLTTALRLLEEAGV